MEPLVRKEDLTVCTAAHMAKQEFIIDGSGRALEYSQSEIEAVIDAMVSADPLTQGKYLEQFEKEFAKYIGVPYAFAVANCTNALDLASLLMGLRKGDEVIIPAHTFCATAIPFARTGAKIVWADIDPDTRLVSADSIRHLLTPRTRAIVVVHLYGLMAEMDNIVALAKQHDCYLVEDCAQAIGAEYKGKKAGSIGDFGTFSFHGQKNLTTLGEGGVLCAKSKRFARLVPGLRHNGVRAFEGDRSDYWMPAMSNVDADLDGVWPYNFCIGEVQCALGSQLLKRLDAMNEVRIARANRFREALSAFPELSFQAVSPNHKHVYHLLSAKYDGRVFGSTRDDFIRMMVYKHGIKVIVQYCPLYRYPLFQKMGFGDHDCPRTDEFYDNMVSFPFHLWMSEEQFAYMIESTRHTLLELRRTREKGVE